MAGVQGTGQTTNNLYIGTASANVIGAAFPPEPGLIANFSLDPTNGLALVTLPKVRNSDAFVAFWLRRPALLRVRSRRRPDNHLQDFLQETLQKPRARGGL